MDPFYVAGRLLARFLTPLRSARYRRRSVPFVCRAERNLLFELHPGEEIDRHIAIYGIYERRILHYLESLVPKGGVVLDIGANIGNHALFLSRKAGEVHCFEPNPRAYRRLERNIALNRISNIRVHRFGLGDRNLTARFTETPGNLGAGHFDQDGDIELQIRKGDDAISLPRIDLIKSDVEGMEARVFKGLRGTIRKQRPVIAFECHDIEGWEAIRENLPGYHIVEPVFTRLSPVPNLVPVETPTWHECLIALPS